MSANYRVLPWDAKLPGRPLGAHRTDPAEPGLIERDDAPGPFRHAGTAVGAARPGLRPACARAPARLRAPRAAALPAEPGGSRGRGRRDAGGAGPGVPEARR